MMNDEVIVSGVLALIICISSIIISLRLYVAYCTAAHVPVPFSVYIFFGILLVGVTVYELYVIITGVLWG